MTAPRRWYQALAEAQTALTPHALATVITVAGSAPRGAGTKMLITPQTLHDTLGGGRLEQLVVERARALLDTAKAGCHLEEIALGAHAQQCCGGHVQVLIEAFADSAPHLVLFGAGHVGQAIVTLLAPLGWHIDWCDSRLEQLASVTIPEGCKARVTCHNLDILDSQTATSVPPACESHVLVMTHDHVEDQALVALLASRKDLASLGLIGSASKWARFRQRLRADLNEHEVARIRCPIGIAGIPGKRPEEIAIGVVAELLQLEAARASALACDVDPPASLDRQGLTRREARQLRAHFSAAADTDRSNAVSMAQSRAVSIDEMTDEHTDKASR
ncbi:xanthine dehydrogenase accessory protein XdhC [Cobetia sp. L2A1]|uniref:xanthine dehydrogenase accessory protein XdhC n=1 Tax=Cobetia sp. L2A1 TaxID=2686360 RepID=UPI00131D1C07|nr:xanthine dehydrogenase accessory protein XdhC [Cobetia sp. L2A1]